MQSCFNSEYFFIKLTASDIIVGEFHLDYQIGMCGILGRGWRPSYRNVLLAVRKELNVPCSSKLSTEDLEAEIFLHLLRDYSRHVFYI